MVSEVIVKPNVEGEGSIPLVIIYVVVVIPTADSEQGSLGIGTPSDHHLYFN
jgi:hypothetical protein